VQWWCAATGAVWEWRWVPYPGVWTFIAALAALYAMILRHARARGDSPSATELTSFAAGTLALWAALDWPIGPLGAGYLASVHMVQFLLIGVLAPPLLLHGIPARAYESLEARPSLVRVLGAVTHPIVALGAFTVMIGVTHWPLVVDALMSSQLGSFALDMTWLAAGLLFSWPVAAPVPRRPWFNYPLKMGHLLAASVLNTGVFAFLTFSSLPVYAIYELAPPISALSAREDQRIAGLLTKMGSAPVMWTWVSILFFRWFREDEKEEATESPVSEPVPQRNNSFNESRNPGTTSSASSASSARTSRAEPSGR
jgi:putative membrane protein